MITGLAALVSSAGKNFRAAFGACLSAPAENVYVRCFFDARPNAADTQRRTQ
jgi:hypothetical protein